MITSLQTTTDGVGGGRIIYMKCLWCLNGAIKRKVLTLSALCDYLHHNQEMGRRETGRPFLIPPPHSCSPPRLGDDVTHALHKRAGYRSAA